MLVFLEFFWKNGKAFCIKMLGFSESYFFVIFARGKYKQNTEVTE